MSPLLRLLLGIALVLWSEKVKGGVTVSAALAQEYDVVSVPLNAGCTFSGDIASVQHFRHLQPISVRVASAPAVSPVAAAHGIFRVNFKSQRR
jgi:hypothetical protein